MTRETRNTQSTGSGATSPDAKRTMGPFELGDKLGVGGMGIVYRATYPKNGQILAVKVLTPEMSADQGVIRRFTREMEILKKLRHENIVRYFGGGKSGGQQFYAMELMTGGSMEDILRKKKQLPWEQVVDYGIQIARALEHAHNAGIVHRDLKPANLFIDHEGKLKLGDFGIARDTQRTALTAAGKTVGTYAYMAPEQISGKPPVSRKTDLYALGCVMFEMLTGDTPFDAANPAEMLFKHLEEDPPDVRSKVIDCPVWLEAVVLKLLEKDPEERYYDALATQVALDEVKEKVAQQTSIAKQAAAGGASAVTVKDDGSELRTALGGKKKKKKKKRQEHFYENMWFLLGCLAVLIGGVTWSLWPAGEEQLFAEATEMMASYDPDSSSDSIRKKLDEINEKFPAGPHTQQIQEWTDRIDMDLARRRIEANERRNQEPKSEAERIYRDARRYENFGDRITAVEKYNGLITLFSKNEEERPVVMLAREKVGELQQQASTMSDRIKTVNDVLQRADDAYQRGNNFQARELWGSVVSLYANNQELAPQVQYARDRMDHKDVERAPYEPADSKSPKNEPTGVNEQGDDAPAAETPEP